MSKRLENAVDHTPNFQCFKGALIYRLIGVKYE